MQRENRKEVLIQLLASLIGMALALYAVYRLNASNNFRLFMSIVAVGIFLIRSIRYGIKYQKLQKQEKA